MVTWQLTIDANDPDDYIDRLVEPNGEGTRIWFQPVPEKKTGKSRFHFDATVDRRVRPDTGTLQRYSVLMRDPEGNEFCVA